MGEEIMKSWFPILFGLAFALGGCNPEPDYEILIRGGQVLDGSGSPPVVMDVGVRNGLAHLSAQSFEIQPDYNSGLLEILKAGTSVPVVTQNAKKGMRPYLHPIKTPNGNGVLTEIHPSHHLHQTGMGSGKIMSARVKINSTPA